MLKYSHGVAVAFTIISKERNFEQVSIVEILSAMMERTASLTRHWEPDAFDFFDVYEVPEIENEETFAEKVTRIKEENGNSWGCHPKYDIKDWQREVEEYSTVLGYWEWAVHQIEAEEDN